MMTLSGLIQIIFIVIVVFGVIIFLIECFLIDDIEDVLSIFDWYNERNKIVQHIMDYCFLFFIIFMFIGFLFLICVFMEWGDTIILW